MIETLLGMLAVRLAFHERDVLLRAILFDHGGSSEQIRSCRDVSKVLVLSTHCNTRINGIARRITLFPRNHHFFVQHENKAK